MVSGLVTSPCDQDMIVSGDASESFRASKFSSFSKLFSSYLSTTTLPNLAKSAISRGLRLFECPDSASFGGILPELFALEADPKVKRNLRDVFFAKNDLALVLAQDLDPERKAFKLLDQHAE